MRGRAVTLRVWSFVMPHATELGVDGELRFSAQLPDVGGDVNQALEEEDHARRIRAESHGRHTRA